MPNSILPIYETIRALTEQMLAAARTGDWERLCRLEAICRQHIDGLEKRDEHAPLEGVERERHRALLQRILADEAEIRELAMPQLKHLGELLGSMRRERSVQRAYQF